MKLSTNPLHGTENPRVPGSIPGLATSIYKSLTPSLKNPLIRTALKIVGIFLFVLSLSSPSLSWGVTKHYFIHHAHLTDKKFTNIFSGSKDKAIRNQIINTHQQTFPNWHSKIKRNKLLENTKIEKCEHCGFTFYEISTVGEGVHNSTNIKNNYAYTNTIFFGEEGSELLREYNYRAEDIGDLSEVKKIQKKYPIYNNEVLDLQLTALEHVLKGKPIKSQIAYVISKDPEYKGLDPFLKEFTMDLSELVDTSMLKKYARHLYRTMEVFGKKAKTVEYVDAQTPLLVFKVESTKKAKKETLTSKRPLKKQRLSPRLNT